MKKKIVFYTTYFNEDKLNSAVFNVGENFFNELFNDYDGFKFFTSIYTDYDGLYFYSKETNQVLKASTDSIDGNLRLALYVNDPDFFINVEYLYMKQQELNNQQHSQSDLTIDLSTLHSPRNKVTFPLMEYR